MSLSLEQENSERQVKAFRFNSVATEAHQMFFGQEN